MKSILFLLPALIVASLAAQTPAAPKKAVIQKVALTQTNFKESGSPSAPITIELYTDYECPACREFYLNTLPLLTNDFIRPGKARLIHRDYPLPQHQFTKLATHYANAAGQIGKYDLVAHQIFQTQPEWDQNGNVDAQVAKVLSPAEMEKVRNIVKTEVGSMDDAIAKDQAMGSQDRLQQTPTIVIVYKGKRETIGGALSYPILKSYLEKKLEQ
jgi:protein-disulfide isomerase